MCGSYGDILVCFFVLVLGRRSIWMIRFQTSIATIRGAARINLKRAATKALVAKPFAIAGETRMCFRIYVTGPN